MTDPLVLFHAGCIDGACAAAVAYTKFGEAAEYRAVNYSDPAPLDDEVRGREVYILDFSYKKEEVERFCRVAKMVVLLDHHKTAVEELAGKLGDVNLHIELDVRSSGADLACMHFNGMCVPSARLVCHVSDRDLWKFELPFTREIHAALGARGGRSDFRMLARLLDPVTWRLEEEHLIREGRAILAGEASMLRSIAKHASVVRFVVQKSTLDPTMTHDFNEIANASRTMEAVVVNSPVLQSELGELLASAKLTTEWKSPEVSKTWTEPFPFAAVYYFDGGAGPAGAWRVSLRSDKNNPEAADVSVIAKAWGGGGHKNAAGFECATLEWMGKS